MAPFKPARQLKPGDIIKRDRYGSPNITVTAVAVTDLDNGKQLVTVHGLSGDYAVPRMLAYSGTDTLTVDSADPFEGLS